MIFVSYSHKDETAAKQLNKELEAEHYKTFLADDDVPPGADWHRKILTALKESHSFVGLLTDNFTRSAFCQQEVGAALALSTPRILVVADGARVQGPGFASRFQTAKRDEIMNTINESSKFRAARVQAWIEDNESAGSFEEANIIYKRFHREWNDMKKREQLSWLLGAARNRQVWDEGWHAGPFFKRALKELKSHLTAEWLQENDPDDHLRPRLRKLKDEDD